MGWRDHTDGHRITTTRGDKVEVIGGNYKIVSLGRGTGVASYEMSGGIIVDAMEAPGNQTSVTWRECPTDLDDDGNTNKGWKVVEQTVKGNVVSRFHGTQREEFYGNELISVVGAPDPDTANIALPSNSDGWHAFIDDDQDSFTDDINESLAYPTKWDLRGGTPPKLEKPDIYESTWAKSIRSYTKISNKVREETHYNGGYVNHVYVDDSHTEHFHMAGSKGHFEHFHGAKTEYFIGASTTIGLANRFELFVGVEEQLNVGGMDRGAYRRQDLVHHPEQDGGLPVDHREQLEEDRRQPEEDRRVGQEGGRRRGQGQSRRRRQGSIGREEQGGPRRFREKPEEGPLAPRAAQP